MPKRKQILKQMFDVRPTLLDGSLDLEKIRHLKKTVFISQKKVAAKPRKYRKFPDIRRSGEIFYEKISEDPLSGGDIAASKADAPEEKLARRPNIIQLGKKVSEDLLSISNVSSRRSFTDREANQEIGEFNEDFSNDFLPDYSFGSDSFFRDNMDISTQSLVESLKKGKEKGRQKKEKDLMNLIKA